MKDILKNRFDIKIKLLYLKDKEKFDFTSSLFLIGEPSSHRFACCLHLGIEPDFLIGEVSDPNKKPLLYNEDFFRRIGMMESEIIKVNNEFKTTD